MKLIARTLVPGVLCGVYAHASGGSGSNGKISPILQSLLQDRFGLRAHYEKRQKKLYALVTDRRDVTFREATTADRSMWNVVQGHVYIHAGPLAPLVDGLSTAVGKVVVDKTGLTGRYNIDLKWNPDELSSADNPGPSLFTALREQPGLRSVSTSEPIDVLIIDHFEQPSVN